MANADFEKQNTNPGGFSQNSYRAAEVPRTAPLTPLQKKLSALETALPKALQSRAAALGLAVVLMAAAVFGLGGAKLSARYRAVTDAFVTGTAADAGYSYGEELTVRGNAAANILTTAQHELGEDDLNVGVAQAALEAFRAAMEQDIPEHSLSAMYDADQALGAAIDQLYAALQSKAADPLKMGAVQTQYSDFTNASAIMSTLAYNDEAAKFNKEASGFPAGLIGTLWGAGEAELFA